MIQYRATRVEAPFQTVSDCIADEKWGFRKLTVGKFDKWQVSGIAV
jgi:hypothetical protein